MARYQSAIQELADGKGVVPLWIIDEAQNLPVAFFRDLPAFLNFAFDSRPDGRLAVDAHQICYYTDMRKIAGKHPSYDFTKLIAA